MTNLELDPSIEVVHLRRLLDTQPSCLMRLGADGVVLAANDAALTLLGVTSHAQALGKAFAAWVAPDERDRWTAFTQQVVQGAPASIECGLSAPSGESQATLFHGVPITGHPDGLVSMAVAARAVTGQRQLEAAVVEREELLRELEAEQLQARERLGEADSHRRQLEERVGMLEALLQLTEADASAAPDADLVGTLRADLEARDRALAAAVAARHDAEATCDLALADRRRFEVALEEFAARHQQVTDERAAERHRVLQMLDEVAVKHREELAAARNTPEWDRLTARLEERDAALRTSEAELRAAQAELDEARAGRVRLEAALRDAEARCEAGAAAAAAASARLQQAIDDAGERHRLERLQHERDARQAVAHLEQRQQEAHETIAHLEQRQQEAQAAIARLEQHHQEAQATIARMEQHQQEAQAAIARVEQHHQDARDQRDRLQIRLDQALVACQQCEANLRQQASAHRELVTEHAAAMSERDRLVAALREQALHLTALADAVLPGGNGHGPIADAGGLGASHEETQA